MTEEQAIAAHGGPLHLPPAPANAAVAPIADGTGAAAADGDAAAVGDASAAAGDGTADVNQDESGEHTPVS